MSTQAQGPTPDLEQFRAYLRLLAGLQVDRRWQGKVDVSGVIQETMLEAHQALDQLRQRSTPEVLAWLRTALAHNLADELKRLRADKRDIGREKTLHQALDQSSLRLESLLAADQSSPSEVAQRQEQALRLAATLLQLPDKQRQAVELHHLRGLSLAEVAQELGCTKAAIVGLLHRGVEKLRQLLEREAEG